MKNLIDNAISSQINNMIRYLIIFLIFIVSDMLIQALVTTLSTRNYAKMYNNMEKHEYTHILNTKWIELSKYHSGDLSTRIVSDADSVTNTVMNTIPGIISNFVLLVGSFITLLYINMRLAIIISLLSPVLTIVAYLYSIKLKKLYSEYRKTESEHRSLLHESIQNIVILKTFCAEKSNIKSLTKIQEKKLSLTMKQNRINIVNNSLFSAGSWFSFFAVFTWGAFNLSKGTTTYGTLSALIQLFSNIQYPLLGIASSVPKAIAATASIDRLMEIEELTCDSNDSPIENVSRVGFEFTNVHFNYKNEVPILRGINININSGETVAIIGPSGEGKTTLIRLLLALVYPQEGQIYIKGNSKKIEVNPSCRSLISYVPQGNTLFSGSIAENLKFGNKNATTKELREVAAITYSLDFIETLNNGFDTLIGERGLGLSEGQAQRLAIARALLKKSPVLILDEATSSLDSETELRVLETIRNLEYNPTCLIITHRPSALAICDRVLKLDNGELIEINNSFEKESAMELDGIFKNKLLSI